MAAVNCGLIQDRPSEPARSNTRLVPCPNVGQASTNHNLHLRVRAPYGVCFLYCDKFTPFSHLKSRLFIHRPLTPFVDRFIYYIEKFLSRIADILEVVR